MGIIEGGNASSPDNSDSDMVQDMAQDKLDVNEEDGWQGTEPGRSACFYCVNCTARSEEEDAVCPDCGHHPDADRGLFMSGTAAQPSSSSPKPKVVLLHDERMELHEEEGSAPPHPERPDRIRAVMARVLASGLGARCERVSCREATIPELAAVHTGSLIQLVQDASARAHECPEGSAGVSITPDTYVNAHTFLCARLAAGGAAQVASMVARGEAPHGAAIVRPPGHHAESGMAMGFCFFNNAAVAARAAQAAGARRVIILDWDIHHGNGTQHIFEHDPSVLYMSLHRYDGGQFYPGTGGAHEAGLGDGEGYNVNVPWDSADMGNGDYLSAFHQVLVPIAYEYNPDLIIVSAGFDAADGDPIGECRVTPECFAHMTSMLKAIAPLVLLLEGGYNLHSTAVSTEACLRVLLGEEPGCLPGARYPSAFGWKAIEEAVQVQSRYWKCLRRAGDVPRRHGVYWQQAAAELEHDDQHHVSTPEPGVDAQPSETLQRSSRAGLAAAAGGVTSAKQRPERRSPVLVAIHKRAMRAFWKRQRRLAKQLQVAL